MKCFVFIFLLFGVNAFSQKELKHQVYFDTDKHHITSTEHSRILYFISKLDSLDIEKISIYGFCDDRGTDAYNLKLSQRRADAIKNIFTSNEFDNSKITNVDGKGEVLLKKIKGLDVERTRGLNRKTEIIVSLVYPPESEGKTSSKAANSILKNNIKVGDKLLLENVLFKMGSTYILPESVPALQEIAKELQKRTDIYFTIQGHVCCTKGARDAINRKTNQRNLSLVRARFIYDYLSKKGISKRRMKYVGLQRRFPLGGSPKYDRRIEILVTKVGKNN